MKKKLLDVLGRSVGSSFSRLDRSRSRRSRSRSSFAASCSASLLSKACFLRNSSLRLRIASASSCRLRNASASRSCFVKNFG